MAAPVFSLLCANVHAHNFEECGVAAHSHSENPAFGDYNSLASQMEQD